jgi:hypothetical protein
MNILDRESRSNLLALLWNNHLLSKEPSISPTKMVDHFAMRPTSQQDVGTRHIGLWVWGGKVGTPGLGWEINPHQWLLSVDFCENSYYTDWTEY